MHACLALGFQGIHRTSAGGAVDAADDPAQPLRDAAARQAEDRPTTCRRAGRARRSPRGRSRCRVPVWAVGRGRWRSLLFGFYITLRTLLGGEADAVAASARRRCIPTGEIDDRAQRVVAAAAAASAAAASRTLTQLQRIRAALAAEITADGLTRTRPSTSSSCGRQPRPLRQPARPRCCDSFKPIAAQDRRHAREGAAASSRSSATPTTCRSRPCASRRTTSSRSSAPRRSPICSRADLASPTASAGRRQGRRHSDRARTTTPEGRPKNRRVEIMIPRSGLSGAPR